jgi:thioredoxin-dependent peroxiredoxin
VVGVSGDSTEKAERFQRELDLPFPVVGDPSGTILRAYAVRWPLVGWARRVTYLVGPDGTVQDVYHDERHPLAHVDRVCRRLAARS